MNTSLEHLPEHKQKQLREITGIIVKAVDPEKVILFGSHATGRWVEHRYTEGGITYEYISDYDILVITKSGESRKDYEVQDVIENRCVYKTPVTVITHDIDFVNKMLTEGQYFFTDIEQEGILLYDAGTTPLAERKPLSPAEAKAIAQNYFDQWYHSAVNFLQMSIYAEGVGNLNRIEHLQAKPAVRAELTPVEIAAAIQEWKTPQLLKRINQLIGDSGIVGEPVNRLIAFIVYTSRKLQSPLHLMFLGSSGSSKTYLQEKVSELIPKEDKIEITQITENVFY